MGHQYIDVKSDAKNMSAMLALSNGVRKVPVIVEDDKVTIGYGGS